MPPEPGAEPTAWLAAAWVHLGGAQTATLDARLRCFHGQRAVELVLKALLIQHGVGYPFSHSLHRLITALPIPVPDHVHEAAQLTAYAVEEMYPDTFTDLSPDHAAEAVELARAVVEWAAAIIEP